MNRKHKVHKMAHLAQNMFCLPIGNAFNKWCVFGCGTTGSAILQYNYETLVWLNTFWQNVGNKNFIIQNYKQQIFQNHN